MINSFSWVMDNKAMLDKQSGQIEKVKQVRKVQCPFSYQIKEIESKIVEWLYMLFLPERVRHD